MKLAILLSSLGGGGAERMLVRLSNGLSERGHDVDLMTVRAEGPLVDAVEPGVCIRPMPRRRARYNVRSMARYLRAESPDVIVASQPHMDMLAVASRHLAGVNIPVVLRIANVFSSHIAGRPGPRGWLLREGASLSYRRADAVVGVSDGVSADIRQALALPHGKVSTIYNGIIGDEFWQRLDERLPVAMPGQDCQQPVVVSVGRLVPQKNQSLLLEAFARAFKDVDARLMIVGEGPEREKLARLGAQLGLRDRLTLTGFLENPLPLLKAATVFALSSDHEGLPGVLIEALAAGCEVVSTDCPSGPDEILRGGDYGRLVPVGEVDALALALRDAASGIDRRNTDPAESVARFHGEEMVRQYEGLFRKLCGTP